MLRAPCLADRWLLLTVCSRGREKERSSSLSFLRRQPPYPHSSLLAQSLRKNLGKESACNAGDPSSIPGSGRALEEGLATHSRMFAGKSHGQWNLAGYSPWDHRESDMTERLTHTSLPLWGPCPCDLLLTKGPISK